MRSEMVMCIAMMILEGEGILLLREGLKCVGDSLWKSEVGGLKWDGGGMFRG